MFFAAGSHTEAVKLVLPTIAPRQGSAAAFYTAVVLELHGIQDVLYKPLADSESQDSAERPYGGRYITEESNSEATDAFDVAAQLETEIHCLWRLDDAMLRTSSVDEILDAPPLLAPGPQVCGAASAVIRLKQLRAAFVSRSQQVNMAHSSYRCVSKHNDLYKTYVRTSADGFGEPRSTDDFTEKPVKAKDDVLVAAAVRSTSRSSNQNGWEPELHTDSDSQLGDATDTSYQSAALSRSSIHSASRRNRQGNRRKSESSCDSSSTVCSSGHRSSGSGKRALETTEISTCKSDSLRIASSNSSSTPGTAPTRPDTFAERIMSSIPQRVRCGFFGLAGFFGRGRMALKDMPPNALQQLLKEDGTGSSALLKEEDTEAPSIPVEESKSSFEQGDNVLSFLRRSLSEPALAGRRCGGDFGRDPAAFPVQGQEGADPNDEVAFRESRELKRSGESACSLRSRSEPATARNRGGGRARHRRAGFAMASVDDVDEEEYFITPDLHFRSQQFNSEQQPH